MNKIQQAISGTKGFVDEVRMELKKCSWPSRSELVESTVVVFVSVFIVAVFVGFCDLVLQNLLRLVVR